jgi:predicted PurR-regulated permease PerM
LDQPPTERATAGPYPPLGHYAKVTAVVILVVALAALAWTARGLLLMVFVSFVFAAGLDPIVSGLERRGLRRGYAVLALVLAVLIPGVIFVWLAVGLAVEQAAELVSDIPELLDALAERFGGSRVAGFLASEEFENQLRGALDSIVEFAEVSVDAIFGALGAVANVGFAIITAGSVTVYFMLGLPRMKAFGGRALGAEDRAQVLADALQRVGGYLTGQLGICACAGISSWVVFVITGVPYAAVLALVVAILDAVPQVGATLAAIIAIAVALTQSVGAAVVVLIFFIVYQQVENLVIGPRVFASAVFLRPMTVFLAVLFGGTVGGFVGAIVALPIAAALKVVFRYVFRGQLAVIDGRAVPESVAPPSSPPRRSRHESAVGGPPGPLDDGRPDDADA